MQASPKTVTGLGQVSPLSRPPPTSTQRSSSPTSSTHHKGFQQESPDADIQSSRVDATIPSTQTSVVLHATPESARLHPLHPVTAANVQKTSSGCDPDRFYTDAQHDCDGGPEHTVKQLPGALVARASTCSACDPDRYLSAADLGWHPTTLCAGSLTEQLLITCPLHTSHAHVPCVLYTVRPIRTAL